MLPSHAPNWVFPPELNRFSFQVKCYLLAKYLQVKYTCIISVSLKSSLHLEASTRLLVFLFRTSHIYFMCKGERLIPEERCYFQLTPGLRKSNSALSEKSLSSLPFRNLQFLLFSKCDD